MWGLRDEKNDWKLSPEPGQVDFFKGGDQFFQRHGILLHFIATAMARCFWTPNEQLWSNNLRTSFFFPKIESDRLSKEFPNLVVELDEPNLVVHQAYCIGRHALPGVSVNSTT